MAAPRRPRPSPAFCSLPAVPGTGQARSRPGASRGFLCRRGRGSGCGGGGVRDVREGEGGGDAGAGPRALQR
uniref:Uncharacterized protein n=1 Tax=Arundo donax TaxID=35708 RepID=A0A0A9HV27_ARUDO